MIVLPREKCNDELPGKKMPLALNNSRLVYVILSPVLSALLALLNLTTIIAVVKRFRISSLSLILLVNICICDIIVCLGSNNFYLVNLLHPQYLWSTGPLACKLFRSITMMMNFSQIFSLITLSIDRTRRLIHNIRSQWHKKDGVVIMSAVWILSVLLAAPRMILFDEKVIVSYSPEMNETVIMNYACKPSVKHQEYYNIYVIVQFIIGYALPACILIVNQIASKFLSHQHLKILGQSSLNSKFVQKNGQLASTFNLVGILFLIVWTPFFLLSIIDIDYDVIGRKDMTHLNFTLRCTLLLIGSAKPVIYLMCLKKFRRAWVKQFFGSSADDTSESVSNRQSVQCTKSSKSTSESKEISSHSNHI